MKQRTLPVAHAGFSIMEMMLVVAVVAILATLIMPSLTQFLDQRNIQEENNIMAELEDALAAFSVRYNRLPLADVDNPFCNNDINGDAISDWAECLTLVTNLSVEQITTDVWGEPRMYVVFENQNEQLLGETIPMFYVTIFGKGLNRVADGEDSIGVPIDAESEYQPADHMNWWSNGCTTDATACLQAFNQLQFPNTADDHLVKFTDREIKMRRYDQTLERLQKISAALGQFSQARYNEALLGMDTAAVAAGSPDADVDKRIYFPPTVQSIGLPADPISNYGQSVQDVMNTQPADQLAAGGRISYDVDDAVTRRAHMITLMRILGLPDDYCCTPMVRLGLTPEEILQEMPFYYYSNPRPVLNSSTTPVTCASTRPASTDTVPAFLPARASLVAYGCP